MRRRMKPPLPKHLELVADYPASRSTVQGRNSLPPRHSFALFGANGGAGRRSIPGITPGHHSQSGGDQGSSFTAAIRQSGPTFSSRVRPRCGDREGQRLVPRQAQRMGDGRRGSSRHARRSPRRRRHAPPPAVPARAPPGPGAGRSFRRPAAAPRRHAARRDGAGWRSRSRQRLMRDALPFAEMLLGQVRLDRQIPGPGSRRRRWRRRWRGCGPGWSPPTAPAAADGRPASDTAPPPPAARCRRARHPSLP